MRVRPQGKTVFPVLPSVVTGNAGKKKPGPRGPGSEIGLKEPVQEW